MTQARCHPPAREIIACRKAGRRRQTGSVPHPQRRLSDAVYQALQDVWMFGIGLGLLVDGLGADEC